MGLVISGLQRARVLAALQVRGGMWSHPHRHQVRSGCSLSPFYGGQQRAREGNPLPSLPTKAWLSWDSPRTPGLCAVSLPDAGQPQPEGVCTCVLSGAQARGSQGFWEGNPQFTPVSSLPTSGRYVGDSGFRTQQQTGGQQGLACSMAPSFTPPSDSGWGGGRAGERALCSEWLLGEHTAPLRTPTE